MRRFPMMMGKAAALPAAVAALSLLAAPACAPVDARSGQMIGLSARDKQIGAQGYKEILEQFGGRVDGPLADYVRSVGLKVAIPSVPGSTAADWTITVLDSPVPNAMATPGGYLYITRGMLAMINSEAELASVLGHEAGHVAANHSQQRNTRATLGGLATIAAAVLGGSEVAQIANIGASAWVSGFSRSQENEADTLGMRYAMAAGYDPKASASMLAALDRVAAVEGKESMERGGLASFFSTHPITSERVRRVSQAAAATGRTGTVNRDAFLNALNGMTFGDSPAQGIISGPSFRHASLGIGFDAPVGFSLQNSPSAVQGQGRDGSNFLFVGARLSPGQSLHQLVTTGWQQINNGTVPQVNYNEQRINSLDAALSTARLNSNKGAVDVGVHAFRTAADQAYIIRTIAPAGRGGQFDSLISSFRRLTQKEKADAARGRHIEVVRIQPGQTVASLAARMSPPYNRDQSLLALNGFQPSDVRAGQRIKLIVE